LLQLLEGFERAWQGGNPPQLETFLPAGDSLRSAVLVELIHVDLACRLAKGDSARVEQYLQRYPELANHPGLLLELLGAEYQQRWRHEPNIRPAEYVQRFPQHQEQLWSRLQSLDLRLGERRSTESAAASAAGGLLVLPHTSAALERILQIAGSLEAAWRRGEQPQLDVFLTSGTVFLQQAVLVELVYVDLENRLGKGEPARVETYLQHFPELAEIPGALLDLLEAEYQQRWHREPDIRPAEYLQRFPQQQEQVWSRLQSLELRLGEAGVPGDRQASPVPPGVDAPTVAEEHKALKPLLATTATPLFERPKVSGFDILGELGRGGMGVVYKARQTKLNRVVALKMILAGGHADDADLARFRSEARSAARLQHPNIVQIHEIGEHNGLPYFSLEYCPGGSLAEQLDGTPLPSWLAAGMVETLARTMHAAHQRGIVHRDLKPANVLLSWEEDAFGSSAASASPAERAMPPLDRCILKITDFGLAKKLDASYEQRTQSGAILGTPSYMAPEQALGKSKEVAPTADVYALGAILYELMTGRPPFKAATPLDTLLQVLSAEPVPPRKLRPKVPLDLETICLKCLQKEPNQRYPSAKALARDLRYFLDGEPIDARPMGRTERLIKWVKRRPLVVCLWGVVLLAILCLVSESLWYSSKLQDAHQVAEQASQKAKEQGEALDKSNQQGAAWQKRAVEAEERSDRQEKEARKQLLEAATARYALQLVQAQHALQKDDAAWARATLEQCRPDLRGWEHAHLWRRLDEGERRKFPGHTDAVTGVALSASGKRLISGSADQTVKVWDVPTGQNTFTLTGHADKVSGVAISADGARLVSGSADGTVRVWNATTGRNLLNFPGHTRGATSVALRSDGQRLASGSGDGTVRVWNAISGSILISRKEHTDRVTTVVFSTDGKRLVSGSADGTVKVWDAHTGQITLTLKGHTRGVTSVAISADGKVLATAAGDNTLRLWEAMTGKELQVFKGHAGTVGSVVLSPDGKRLVSVGELVNAKKQPMGTAITIRDTATGLELLTLEETGRGTGCVVFNSNGHQLVLGVGNTVRVLEGTPVEK
jgi:WD40 repeat protein/serine/threonine protein kinase